MEDKEKNNNIEKDIEGKYENNETQKEAKKYNAEKFSLTILIITIAIIATIIIAIIKVVCGLIDAGEFMINEIKTEIMETESKDIYL